MIVADNNALNAYLKPPPLFVGERGTAALFPIAAPRRVPTSTEDHGDALDKEPPDKRGYAEPVRVSAPQKTPTSAATDTAPADTSQQSYDHLTRLRLARAGDSQLDAALSRGVATRASLQRAGTLPAQLVTAGGHAFDTATQARATWVAGRLFQLRKARNRDTATRTRRPFAEPRNPVASSPADPARHRSQTTDEAPS